MFFIINCLAALATSLVLSSTLFWLTARRTPANLAPYARIIRVHLCADIAAEVCNFLTSIVSANYSRRLRKQTRKLFKLEFEDAQTSANYSKARCLSNLFLG